MTNLAGSIHPVEVGRVYLMGLQFPGELNEVSPLVPPPPSRLHLSSGDWLVRDAHRSSLRPRIRNIRRHFGVVFQWHPTTHNAVILIGTSQSQQPQRYVPWYGTPRISNHQTSEVLIPTPRDVFIERQGYLNFTHAIRVRVSGEDDSLTVPGQSFFKDASSSLGGFPVTLHTNEVQKLFRLHEGYWGGVRFNEDGWPVDGDGGGGSGSHDGEDTSDSLDKTPEALSRAAWKLNVPPAPPISPIVPGGNVGTVHNPVDPATGLSASQLMRLAGEEEDFRATQLELMQGIGLGDLSQDVASMISCYLEEVCYNLGPAKTF